MMQWRENLGSCCRDSFSKETELGGGGGDGNCEGGSRPESVLVRETVYKEQHSLKVVLLGSRDQAKEYV